MDLRMSQIQHVLDDLVEDLKEIKIEEMTEEEVGTLLTKIHVSSLSSLAIFSRMWPTAIGEKMVGVLADEGWPEVLVAEDNR